MRVAIVGAGVAGLTAAYLLRRAHEVEVFERNEYAGGHANTVTVPGTTREIALDTGFIVYNEHTYPGFTALLRDLRVPTQPSDMSLSVRCRACDLEYSSRGMAGMLAQRSNALRPGRWRLGIDILRFFSDTRRVLREGGFEEATLGEFLRARKYSGEFVRHFIIPLASAVWSMPSGTAGEFPLRYLLTFLDNHGIIGLRPAFEWRTVRGGSKEYVRRMTEGFVSQIRLGAPVRAVHRCPDGVALRLADGSRETYDHVVFACHADEALRLLRDASCREQTALAGFSYTTSRVMLHTDASLLPTRRAARASWNYATDDCRAGGGALSMTYHLNRLQALDEPRDYCVTLNGHVAPDTVIREMTYDHPAYSFETLAAQQALAAINGERRTWFAGAHLGYGFHEDAFQSGVRVAAALGVLA